MQGSIPGRGTLEIGAFDPYEKRCGTSECAHAKGNHLPSAHNKGLLRLLLELKEAVRADAVLVAWDVRLDLRPAACGVCEYLRCFVAGLGKRSGRVDDNPTCGHISTGKGDVTHQIMPECLAPPPENS